MIARLVDLLVGLVLGALATWLWSRRPGPESVEGARAAPQDARSSRSELISKIAHELKNPIMSVKGLASTGSRLYDSLSDEERRDLFRLIDAEAGRLKLIADETSTTLKIDAGTLAYDLSEQDVGGLVEQATWRTPVGDHPVSVRTEAGLVARADPARLAEVLTNLVDNAAKFSPAGSPIEVRALRRDGGIVVEIIDAGPGIPDDRKAAVFDRYATWRPPGYEEVPGAGLGLHIARAHVAAHRGRLDIVDGEPRGSILRVWLPAGG